MDIIHDEFPEARKAIDRRISEVLDAVKAKDFERLASYHLHSTKFTKFNDIEPMGRLDIDACNRSEQAELAAVGNVDGTVHELKIDVFGPVAVVTGILENTFEMNGQSEDSRTRATAVFVNDGGDWKIAHEHLSTLPQS